MDRMFNYDVFKLRQFLYMVGACFIVFVVSLLIVKCLKTLQEKREVSKTERNIKKRLILAHYETILDMSEEDKSLMQQTYLNTLQNSKYPPDISKTKNQSNKISKIRELKERTVQFLFPSKILLFAKQHNIEYHQEEVININDHFDESLIQAVDVQNQNINE